VASSPTLDSPDLFRRGVRDMYQRDANGSRDHISHLVHRVGAQHQQLAARGFKRTRFGRQPIACLAPRVRPLQLFDLREVDRPQNAIRGMQTTQPSAGRFVDQPVVLRRGLPAHTTQQTDTSHNSRA
jgi:hypothetical protein